MKSVVSVCHLSVIAFKNISDLEDTWGKKKYTKIFYLIKTQTEGE